MDEACRRCGARPRTLSAQGLCPDCIAAIALEPTVKDTQTGASESSATDDCVSFGDYEILSKIAHGGMGVVYKARQRSLNRIVAVKTIRADRLARPDDIKRFRTEAQAAAQLQHPNIVAIHEVGEADGQHFYSMDYVEGRSLAQIARETPLTPRQAAGYVKAIAEAIQYAHSCGILHRDLKPSNVLIDRNDQARVADFGLAKVLSADSELTVSGVVMGSPSYMPPEQAGGRTHEVDTRSDVYSLGAILYDLLCGRPPFRADSAVETLRQVVELEPVAPRLLNPRVPRDLETICLKCLEKSASDRYETAQQVADELGRFIRGEPIDARPIGRTEKLWRWSKRKPAAAAALALLLLILIGSPVATIFINQARRAAEQNRKGAEANLYVAEMNLALEDVQSDHRARAIALLNKNTPKAGMPDPRSFEWRYIWRQARGDYAFKLGLHPDAVRQVASSEDGTLVISRSVDGVLKVWDVRTRGEPLSITNVLSFGGFEGSNLFVGTQDGSVDIVNRATASRAPLLANAGILVRALNHDRAVATTSTNWLLKVWNLETRKETRTLPGIGGGEPGRGAPWALSVVTSSNAAVAASIEKSDPQLEKKLLHVWDVASGRELARSPVTDSPIVALQISDDARFVAYAVQDLLHIWDWQHQNAPQIVKAHSTPVRMITFSPDARLIATGASDQFIRIWSTETGTLRDVRKGHENSVRALAFSPDGNWLISGGLNESVRVWKIKRQPEVDGVEARAGDRKELPLNARDLLISPDNRFLVFATLTNSAAILNLGTLTPVDVHESITKVLRFALNASDVVGLARQPTASCRWIRSGQSISAPEAARASLGRNEIAVSADLQFAAAPGTNNSLHIWNVASGHDTEIAAPGRGLAYLTFSPDAKLLAACDDQYRVHLWRVPAGPLLATFTNHTANVHHLAFSPDGTTLASGGSDKTVMLWDVATLRRRAVLSGHRHAVYAVAFSPDHKLLATGSLDNTVKFWNLGFLQEVGRFNTAKSDEILPEKGVYMVAFAPDGNTLAARMRDGSVRVWRAASWEQIRADRLD